MPTDNTNHITVDQLRDIVQDAHLNFLVGAGASSRLFGMLGDVESNLTEIDQSTADGQSKKRARASLYADFFDAVLVKNRNLLGEEASALGVIAEYGRFLQTLNRVLLRRKSTTINKQVNLFTTNVDLAIEVAAETLRLELNDGFSGRFRPRFSTTNFGTVTSRRSLQYDNLSEVPTFNLLKLHGSVGWVAERDGAGPYAPQASDIVFDSRLTSIDDIEERLTAIRSLLIEVTKDTSAASLIAEPLPKQSLAPLDDFLDAYEALPIVYPRKAKFQQTVLQQNYYDLLRVFSNELEKENSVLFVIGFSCRDEHIRELMIRAARSNPTLQIFVMAYSPADISSIEFLFDDQQITNGNIKVIGPRQADATETQEMYSLSVITDRFFEPLVPKPPRRPDATVDISVALQDPLVLEHG